jgi:IclR family transcriptional regulator, acetate operon repressor
MIAAVAVAMRAAPSGKVLVVPVDRGSVLRYLQAMSPIHRNEGEVSGIGRAAALLREFRHGGGMLTGADLVRRTGLPKTTVHRLMSELVRTGLVEQEGHVFRLSLLMFELGQLAPRPSTLHDAARPYMADLHQATQQNVGLAVLSEGEVVYLEILPGKDAPRLPQRVGSRWPAHASCSGKAILAFSGDALAEIARHPLRRLTEYTITDPIAFASELERIRRRGVAYDRQESFSVVAGAASPVTGPDGEVTGALSVSGLAGRINLTRVEAAVRAGALAISRELVRAQSVVSPVLGKARRPVSEMR